MASCLFPPSLMGILPAIAVCAKVARRPAKLIVSAVTIPYRLSGEGGTPMETKAVGLVRRVLLAFFAPTCFALAAGAAHAIDYPTRSVRFVVGFAPGGPTDILTRVVAER